MNRLLIFLLSLGITACATSPSEVTPCEQDPYEAIKLGKSAYKHSNPPGTYRVFKDDYQRIPVTVTKPPVRKIIWLGEKKD